MTDLELAKVIDAARDEVVVQRNAALAEVARAPPTSADSAQGHHKSCALVIGIKRAAPPTTTKDGNK